MRIKRFNIIAMIFLTLFYGCHTIYIPGEKKFSSLPSMIDTSLIGVWKTDIQLMDATDTNHHFIEFTKDRHIFYKEYYGDQLFGNLPGEYRIVYDTLYVLFNRRALEAYLYKININKSALYLEQIVAEQNGFTLTNGGWYKYNVNYQEN